MIRTVSADSNEADWRVHTGLRSMFGAIYSVVGGRKWELAFLMLVWVLLRCGRITAWSARWACV